MLLDPQTHRHKASLKFLCLLSFSVIVFLPDAIIEAVLLQPSQFSCMSAIILRNLGITQKWLISYISRTKVFPHHGCISLMTNFVTVKVL